MNMTMLIDASQKDEEEEADSDIMASSIFMV
jgi:hypothetical protein